MAGEGAPACSVWIASALISRFAVTAVVAVNTAGIALRRGIRRRHVSSVSYNNDGTSLDFTAPSQLVGNVITSYNYEDSVDGGTTVERETSTTVFAGEYGNTATSSPYVDGYGVDDCPVGTTCSYRIQAVFDGGATSSDWSSWVAETSFGSAPTLNSVTYNNDGTLLNFTAPTLSSGLTITSYNYEDSVDGGTTVERGTSTTVFASEFGNTATSSPYIDGYGVDDCPIGTTCSYRIQAVVGSGSFMSPWSSWVIETPFGSAPTLNSVTYNNDGTLLNFTAPTLSSGLTITSYNYEDSVDGGTTVERGTSTTVFASEFGNTATSSPYIDGYGVTDCPVGTTCSYRIQAVVGSGSFMSPWSSWSLRRRSGQRRPSIASPTTMTERC